MITHVQRAGSAIEDTDWTSTKTCSVSGVTVGNALFVLLGGGHGVTLSSVTDDVGNSYTVDVAEYGTNNDTAAIASCLNVVFVPNTITLHLTGNRDCDTCITVEEFSGIASSSALDQTATLAYGWLGPGLSIGPTGTTAQADELVIALWGVNPHTVTWTKGTNYMDFGPLVGGEKVMFSEYRILSSTGAQTATGTLSTDTYLIGALATYKGAPPTYVKNVAGVADASVKSVSGVPLASVKKISGVS